MEEETETRKEMEGKTERDDSGIEKKEKEEEEEEEKEIAEKEYEKKKENLTDEN